MWRNKFDLALNKLLKKEGLKSSDEITYKMFYNSFFSFPVEDI